MRVIGPEIGLGSDWFMCMGSDTTKTQQRVDPGVTWRKMLRAYVPLLTMTTL
jgi:hypothetical protein